MRSPKCGIGDNRQRSLLLSGHSSIHAFTMIEVLAVMFVVTFAVSAFMLLVRRHGLWPAVAGAIVAGGIASGLVVAFYVWMGRRSKRQLDDVRERYRNIYRVKSLPADEKSIVKPEGAEIRIGDYGWEAVPNRKDGLIHLHGLTTKWHVVWHAGFRPDQLENVGPKPSSQYDHWRPDWAPEPAPPPCPYPVQPRKTPTMGLPYPFGNYLETHPPQDA